MSAVLLPTHAYAWGDKGHRLIAADAWARLSTETKAAIAELIGPGEEALLAASTWSDEVRPLRRDTAPWHYVNVPVSADGYDAKRDCPTGRCIVAKIPELIRAAADKSSAVEQRAEALKFVIHLIGDLHQPFHVGDNNDRGGNDTWLELADHRVVRVHEHWDVTVLEGVDRIAPSIDSRSNGVQDLRTDDTLALAVEAWANESHRLAKEFAPALALEKSGAGTKDKPYALTVDVLRAAGPAASARLQAAAQRLAFVLEAIRF